jgi:hypothetical protein
MALSTCSQVAAEGCPDCLSGQVKFYFETEKAFFKLSKENNYDILDAYGTIKGKIDDIGIFVIPNSYGQGGSWFESTEEKDL